MAAFAFEMSAQTVVYGRSGYNKDGDNEDDKMRSFGRSGYNKDGDDEDEKCFNFGRSGYNKGGDRDDDDKGRSGYN